MRLLNHPCEHVGLGKLIKVANGVWDLEKLHTFYQKLGKTWKKVLNTALLWKAFVGSFMQTLLIHGKIIWARYWILTKICDAEYLWCYKWKSLFHRNVEITCCVINNKNKAMFRFSWSKYRLSWIYMPTHDYVYLMIEIETLS